MNKYLSFTLVNGALVAAFVIGNLYALPTLAALATFIWWVVAIIGVAGVIAISYGDEETLKESAENFKKVANKWVSLLYTIGIAGLLMYFQYPVLGIVMLAYAYIIYKVHNILEKYQVSTEK